MPYWEMFHELSDQRNASFGGAGSIRFEVVTEWLNEQRIFDVLDRHRYREILRSLDREYLREVNKERKSNPASGTGSSRPSRQIKR